ncbi:hypothetical protein CONCODRAFT_170510 [Conidiobolus coronatus NRRL 28638]|uniref:F-box domain-containing protein n=1 Tax=Conidiobolus coronatus (strain ATCC 28846 / CBS 209.66 / NRRL 28638) TaxID=796925 RepID=A0A137P6N5_CONC2|nr:hypothetical protein CONCODRAFT_170510 [Conidiobolus coronatus NRRL 28638]|eukprot:KXN70677.1 hypothetical protein CONCODRAFT_170510 [Conidiobolus coronatus NRRL 28638]
MVLDWVDMVFWKDFNCYFDQADIIEMSLVSKRWRLKLMPIVFKKIGYRGTPNRIGFYQYLYRSLKSRNNPTDEAGDLVWNDEGNSTDHSADCDEFSGKENYYCGCFKALERIHDYDCGFQVFKRNNEIKNESKTIHKYVKQLKIFELLDCFPFQYHYHIPFIGMFSNLTHLDLEYTRFYLYQFENIFKSLNKLEYLALRENIVIVDAEEHQSVINLEFPKSINTLYIKQGVSFLSESGYLDYLDYFQFLEDEEYYFSFQPQHLPNLRRLTYINGVRAFDTIVIDFLNINPQLKYLGSSVNAFTLPLLNQISTHPSLKQLAVIKESDIYPPNIESSSSTSDSVGYLEINFCKFINYSFFEKITLFCPNITHFHLKINGNWEESAAIISPVIKKLTRLHTLSITGFPDPIRFISDITRNSTVKRLNLTEINLYFLDLTLIEKLCNISHININYNTFVYPNDQVELSTLIQKYLNWKVLTFKDSVNFYKIYS